MNPRQSHSAKERARYLRGGDIAASSDGEDEGGETSDTSCDVGCTECLEGRLHHAGEGSRGVRVHG